MIVDTSALLAILFDEPEGAEFARLIAEAPVRWMSTASLVEAGIVADRHSPSRGGALDALIGLLEIEPQPVTLEHARLAREAYRTWGKGRSAAGLNFGDCFAYALSIASGEPLLFKGDDFCRTDVSRL